MRKIRPHDRETRMVSRERSRAGPIALESVVRERPRRDVLSLLLSLIESCNSSIAAKNQPIYSRGSVAKTCAIRGSRDRAFEGFRLSPRSGDIYVVRD